MNVTPLHTADSIDVNIYSLCPLCVPTEYKLLNGDKKYDFNNLWKNLLFYVVIK